MLVLLVGSAETLPLAHLDRHTQNGDRPNSRGKVISPALKRTLAMVFKGTVSDMRSLLSSFTEYICSRGGGLPGHFGDEGDDDERENNQHDAQDVQGQGLPQHSLSSCKKKISKGTVFDMRSLLSSFTEYISYALGVGDIIPGHFGDEDDDDGRENN